MSLVKLTLTKGEACAVGVALDNLVEQLTQHTIGKTGRS